ncbi:MAG TPA: response regulator [Thermoanaerobaculia bacterium]|nr:response regulator [Thermoanaerobaculia bacterium]
MDALRILLVEDDEDDFVVARDLLAEIPDLEVSLEWVREYPAGLDRVRSGDHDLCLVDHNLGTWTGVDFVRALRQLPHAPPAILLTGIASREVDLAGMAAGASDFLEKSGLTSALLDRSIRYTIQKQRAAEVRVDLAVERAARASAEEANRAKDMFLARLSHELRTPMAPILGISSLLEIDESLPAMVREQLHVVRRNAEQEARLIDDLLDLTRINRGTFALNREVVDLERLVREAIETAAGATLSAGRLHLELDLAADGSQVWGDPIRLTQALCNLMTNAVRYTPEGGKIIVRSRRQEPEGIVIEISDDGCGFDPEDVPRLFEAFERAGLPEGGGLGLGLWIARSIIDDHGGVLSAYSSGLGKGASFFVYLSTALPAGATAPSVDPLRLEPFGQGSADRPLHILLVEDHLDTAFAISHLLSRLGHKVSHADSPEVALAAAAAPNDPPIDFVVSDLWLRSGSGLDLMPELASRYGLRGIAISGLGGDGAIARSRAAGFSRHLTKPITFAALRAAISEFAAAPQ